MNMWHQGILTPNYRYNVLNYITSVRYRYLHSSDYTRCQSSLEHMIWGYTNRSYLHIKITESLDFSKYKHIIVANEDYIPITSEKSIAATKCTYHMIQEVFKFFNKYEPFTHTYKLHKNTYSCMHTHPHKQHMHTYKTPQHFFF